MRLNSKVTWGLAWAGLAVVLLVPSADFLTGVFSGPSRAALLTSTTEPVTDSGHGATLPADASSAAPAPVKTASVTTTVTPNGITITPTLKSGLAAPVPAASSSQPSGAAPLLTSNTPSSSVEPAPTQVATAEPAVVTPQPVVAPTPFPARPPDVVALPADERAQEPVIVEETMPPQRQAALGNSAGPVPPAPIVDDSENWNAPGLRKYLARNNLLSGEESRSRATMTVTERSNDYDADGFYLSDGPNNRAAERRRRLEELYEDDDDDIGFSLF